MNRNEALVRIRASLTKYADDLAHYVLDEDKPEEAAQITCLRGAIDGISTIGQAFSVMRWEDFGVRGAVKLVIQALIEDTCEDEFRGVPARGWEEPKSRNAPAPTPAQATKEGLEW